MVVSNVGRLLRGGAGRSKGKAEVEDGGAPATDCSGPMKPDTDAKAEGSPIPADDKLLSPVLGTAERGDFG